MYVEVTMYAYCKYKGVYMEIYYVLYHISKISF